MILVIGVCLVVLCVSFVAAESYLVLGVRANPKRKRLSAQEENELLNIDAPSSWVKEGERRAMDEQ